MDWTLCLVCTLISMTSTRCHQNIPSSYRMYEPTYHPPINDGEWDDVATQRMSERPIPLDSTRQRLQEVQRRFHQEDQETEGDSNSQFLLTRKGPAPTMSPDVVVFPGPVRRQSSEFVPNVPEECLRTGICEDVPNYPEDHVNDIINRFGNKTAMYNVDELETPEIAQRQGGGPEETELCDISRRLVIPRAAPDKEGHWRFIINKKNNPMQGFHVELCKENNSPCSSLAYFYSGYEASCKQKYLLRHMSGLGDNGELVDMPFKLPVCCSCVVKQSD